MKFSADFDRTRTQIAAVPGEFDGVPPVPHLEIGINLQGTINADRLAVGLALVYSPWLAGPLHTPDLTSALTAQRISEFFGERFVTVATVTDRALPIPRGVEHVRIVDLAKSTNGLGEGSSIRLAPFSVRESNVAFGLHQTVASNIHLFAGPPSGLWPPTLHTLGLAVLLAQHAEASVLIHPAADAMLPTLDLLLESVGLGLTSA